MTASLPAPRCYLVWHYQLVHLIFETEERFFDISPNWFLLIALSHCDLIEPSAPSVCFPSHCCHGGMFSPLPRHEVSPGPTSLSPESLKEGVVSTSLKISFSSLDKEPREEHYSAIEGNKHACYNMNLKNMTLSESSLMWKAHIVWFNFYETPRKGKSLRRRSRLRVRWVWVEWEVTVNEHRGLLGIYSRIGLCWWLHSSKKKSLDHTQKACIPE